MSSLLLDNTNIFNLYNEMAFGIAKGGQAQNTLSQKDLIDLIKQTEQQRGGGTNFFGVTQITRENTNKVPGFEPFILSGLKKGKTYIAKVSQVNGVYGHNYGEAVARRREEQGVEGEFKVKASPYQPVEGSRALVQKDGQIYLRYKPLSVARSFRPVLLKKTGENQFEVVNRAAVDQYIIKVDAAKYQGLPEGQGEQIRFLSLAGIAAINIAGRDYAISDVDAMRKAIWQASGAPMPEEVPQQ